MGKEREAPIPTAVMGVVSILKADACGRMGARTGPPNSRFGSGIIGSCHHMQLSARIDCRKLADYNH